ncbi:hypothetical protein [Actinoalloteichus sp. GBA129-24]|uniref:hypothetical protein n=1 Tax=Actinoalloteichus sp. GBA129-24 TaxID=1612551 RepID=UPI0012F711F0|nr:hypothetical protein [Actinoalloteichus sp. GBA129-24]
MVLDEPPSAPRRAMDVLPRRLWCRRPRQATAVRHRDSGDAGRLLRRELRIVPSPGLLDAAGVDPDRSSAVQVFHPIDILPKSNTCSIITS